VLITNGIVLVDVNFHRSFISAAMSMYFLIFSDSVDEILWSNGQAMSTRVAVLVALLIITMSGLLFLIVLSVIIIIIIMAVCARNNCGV
jgi:hypothetical protein